MRLLLWVLVSLILSSATVSAQKNRHNIVVQKYQEVQKSDMFEPGFGQVPVPEQPKGPLIAVADPNEKPAEDYNDNIAAELFKKDTSVVVVELEKSKDSIRLDVGQPLQIVLSEDEKKSAKWHYEGNDFKRLKIVEDFHNEGQRIINIAVVKKGKEKIFFDLIDDSSGNIKVLKSKVLTVTAE